MIQSNSLLALADFQRSYNWDILLPDVQSQAGYFPGQSISLYVQDISFGEYNLSDLLKITHGPLKTHSAGSFDINTVTMEFLCPVDGTVLSYFAGWKGLIVDPSGFYYYPKANYVNGGTNTGCIITLYNADGSPVAVYQLLNIFPKTFPNFSLSYGSEEMVKIPIEFSVDNVILQATNIFDLNGLLLSLSSLI